MSESLPALVLTAGLGTRLFPLTLSRAKPAAPVAGVPLIVRILRSLRAQGVDRVVLNLHHNPESLAAIVGDGSHLDVTVRYSWEQPHVLGSAGGPRHALSLLSDRFLLVNGDTLTDVPLRPLLDQHAASGADITLALVPNRLPDRYGGALVADDGAIVDFTRRGDSRPSWHFVGLQVAEARAFAGLEDGVAAESISGIYRRMMAERPGSVRGWCTDGTFADIGTPEDYLQTNLAFAAAEASPGALISPTSRIASSARVTGSVLWDETVVERDVVLEECVVADGVVIPAGARYRHCALASTTNLANSPPTVPSGVRLDGHLIIAPFHDAPKREPRTDSEPPFEQL